jgi:hypothetical protein
MIESIGMLGEATKGAGAQRSITAQKWQPMESTL